MYSCPSLPWVPLAAICAASGCCIPFPSTPTVTPPLDVTITDGERPIVGAVVTVARYPYRPHFQPELARPAEQRTGADGRSSFTHVEEREAVFPFMMHGVPGYGWQLCAEAPGFVSVVQGLPFEFDGPVPVALVLARGEGLPCAKLLGQTRLEPGDTRTATPAEPATDVPSETP